MHTIHVKRLAALAAVVAMVGGGSDIRCPRLPPPPSPPGIVQHNLGDHDADNNGGPSDGDGSI